MHQSMCCTCDGACSSSRRTLVCGGGPFGGRADCHGAEVAGTGSLVARSSKAQGPPGLTAHGLLAVHFVHHACTHSTRRLDGDACLAGRVSASIGAGGSHLKLASQWVSPWGQRGVALGAGRPSFGMGSGFDHPPKRSIWPTMVFRRLRGDVACCAMAVAYPSGNRHVSWRSIRVGGEPLPCGLFQGARLHLVDVGLRQDE